MNVGNTVFSQLMSLIPDYELRKCIDRSKLYHGRLKIMPKSTLADMNEKKDWHIYQDYAMILAERAKVLYKDEYYRLGIDNMVYAFDSSTINLCLQLCPWARFHHDKGAFKMHTLIDVKNNIPTLSCLLLAMYMTLRLWICCLLRLAPTI